MPGMLVETIVIKYGLVAVFVCPGQWEAVARHNG